MTWNIFDAIYYDMHGSHRNTRIRPLHSSSLTVVEFDDLLHQLLSLTDSDRGRLIQAALPGPPPRIDDDKRTLSGLTVETALNILAHLPVRSVACIAQPDMVWVELTREFLHEYVHINHWRLVDASWAPVASLNKKTLFVSNNALMQRHASGAIDSVDGIGLVRSVASGDGYAVAITLDGNVFTWGNNRNGRLGRGVTNREPLPTVAESELGRVLLPSLHVVAVAAGTYHCLAVTDSGLVYGWGANSYGQCGSGVASVDVLSPTKVEMPHGTKARVASVSDSPSSFVITSDGQLFAFGCNGSGQLGLGEKSRKFDKRGRASLSLIGNRDPCIYAHEVLPQRVIVQETGKAAERLRGAAGGTNHSLAVTESGNVFCWGSNVNNILGFLYDDGIGPASLFTVPTRLRVGDIRDLPVRSVTAHKDRSGVVAENGRLYVWGKCNLGYIEQPVFEPRLMRGVLDHKHAISMSMNCDGTTLVVTNDGSVYHFVSRPTLISGVHVNINDQDRCTRANMANG